MKPRINYCELKLNFFRSELTDVKSFIKERIGNRNGTYQRMTRWRNQEKESFKRDILEKTLKDNKEKMEKMEEVRLQKLDELNIKLIEMIEKKLDENLNIRELQVIRKIIRTEKWLQTNITKNNALEKIAREPIDESLLIKN